MNESQATRGGEFRPLPENAYRVFQQKGEQNAVKVRRVMQLIGDLAGRPWDELRILDLGCGEGVYAIEAGLAGAEVLGVDGRSERMDEGRTIAEQLDLAKVTFEQQDVRRLSPEAIGTFDVVLLLGLLYHLDHAEACDVLDRSSRCCRDLLIIDSHVTLQPNDSVTYAGRTYEGERRREHDDRETPEQRHRKLGSSLDSTFSFWFSRRSIYELLARLGYTTVAEVYVPLEPTKTANRATFVARKGAPVQIASYPWLSGLSEEEIARRMHELDHWVDPWMTALERQADTAPPGTLLGRARRAANRVLGVFGLELHRK